MVSPCESPAPAHQPVAVVEREHRTVGVAKVVPRAPQGVVAHEDRLVVVEVQRVLHPAAEVAPLAAQLLERPRIDHADRSVVEQEDVAIGQNARGVLAAELAFGIVDEVQWPRADVPRRPFRVAQVGTAHPPGDISGSDVDAQHLRATAQGNGDHAIDHVRAVEMRNIRVRRPRLGIGGEPHGEAVLHAILSGYVAPGPPGEDGLRRWLWRDDLDRLVPHRDGGEINTSSGGRRQIEIPKVPHDRWVGREQVISVFQNLEVVGVDGRQRCSHGPHVVFDDLKVLVQDGVA